jgi:hypothetical protein
MKEYSVPRAIRKYPCLSCLFPRGPSFCHFEYKVYPFQNNQHKIDIQELILLSFVLCLNSPGIPTFDLTISQNIANWFQMSEFLRNNLKKIHKKLSIAGNFGGRKIINLSESGKKDAGKIFLCHYL